MDVNAAVNRLALPTKDWGVKDQNDLYNNKSGRKVGNFVIGLIVDKDGEPTDYIQEPIYTDLVTALQTGQKGFSTVVNISQVPPVVFRYNKHVLIHNDDVPNYISGIKDALDEIPTDYIISSLVDIRLTKMERKKPQGIRMLESIIRSKTNVFYNTALIEYVVQEMIYNAREDNIGINQLFQRMSQKESLSFFGAVIEYLLTESTSNEQLAELLENHEIKEIEEAMNRDIAYKYFLGLL